MYHVWLDMKQRCSNINNKRYKNYGGRGIIVCPEWANCYITFRDWAIQNGYAEGLQINRINNNGNYEPNNCNFVTAEENNRNRTTTILTEKEVTEIRNSRNTPKELAIKYNVSVNHIRNIIRNKKWKIFDNTGN